MDNKTQILVVCADNRIRETVIRLVNTNPLWNGVGAAAAEEAIILFKSGGFDLVLLGSGLPEADEYHLTDALKAINKHIPVIKHYGGGSGLLSGEIYQALSK